MLGNPLRIAEGKKKGRPRLGACPTVLRVGGCISTHRHTATQKLLPRGGDKRKTNRSDNSNSFRFCFALVKRCNITRSVNVCYVNTKSRFPGSSAPELNFLALSLFGIRHAPEQTRIRSPVSRTFLPRFYSWTRPRLVQSNQLLASPLSFLIRESFRLAPVQTAQSNRCWIFQSSEA